MAEPKWTPGPWAVGERGTRIVVLNIGGGNIASMAISIESARREKGLANARLIAAAPEMYETLNNLAAEVAAAAARGTILNAAIEQAIDKAGTVLAKARGEP